ncbi:MAG: hypothetical protein ABIG63_06255 [Chloroflexota bacterium]
MDQLTILIVVIVCLLIGFLTGDLIRSIRARNNEAEPEDPPEAISKKEAPNSHWTEILTLWRDRRNESLILEIRGQTFQRETDFAAPARDHLLRTVTELRNWLEPTSATPSSDKEIAISTDPTAKAVLSSTPQSRIKFNPLETFANALRADVPKLDMLPDSIVAQIDAILQAQLKTSPIEEKAIRLMELPGKGMVVMVGLNQYEEIDDVPDESIRALIRSAVAEWERREA